MPNIKVWQYNAKRMEEQPVEYVERKGKGHPDSMLDGIVERTSIELSKYYMDNFGTILHHNVDKGLIIGGSSTAKFGKGVIHRPIEVMVAGRATEEYEGKKIPVDRIAVQAARDHLAENTRFLDLDTEVKISSRVVKGSADLTHIFARNAEMPLANDTSFGVGFAPLTETERLALDTENYLNSKEYKKRMPGVGEDIKVMSIREDENISLNVAIAFVAQHVNSMDDYIEQKHKAIDDIRALTKKITKRDTVITVNSGDSHEHGSIYLTKSGLSMEAGDDGSVGRGNRMNGIITPFRYMSMEAPAGKNPVNHTGKIYNVVAKEVAADVAKSFPQVAECYVGMVSHIGRRIDDPKNMSIKVILKEGEKLDPIRSKIQAVAEDALGNMCHITKEISLGKYPVY